MSSREHPKHDQAEALGRRRRRATRPTTGVSSTTSRMVAPKVRTAQHPSSLIPRRISQHLRVPYRGRARARENSRNQCRLCRRRHKLHKLRNVTDRLPDALGSTVAKKLRAAYHIADRYKPRPNSRRWRASWTAPIPVRPPPCGKGWPRPSRSPGSACRRRWPAAEMGEAAKQSRRVNGFLHLAALRVALERTAATAVTPTGYNKEDAA